MAHIIAFANHKGGVGKTTTVVNAGGGLAELGKKSLLIDLDPQANLTMSLGCNERPAKTIYEALKGECTIDETIITKDLFFDLVPSTLDLSGAELELSVIPGREFILRDLLESVRDRYDFILIDCPPSLSLLTLNALTACRYVYIPLQTEYLALQGLSKLMQVIETIKKRLNKSIELGGVIATRYDSRKALNREVVEKITEYFGGIIFESKIRDNVSLAEAPSYGKTIFEYKPASAGAKDYAALAREIMTRCGK